MIAALSRWFQSFWPAHWWEVGYEGAIPLWDKSHTANPLWFMMSVALLSVTVVGAWPLSIFGAMIHVVVAIGCFMSMLGILHRHGFDWTLIDLLSLHGFWMNALFAGLHYLNVSRNADRFKDGPVQEGDG